MKKTLLICTLSISLVSCDKAVDLLNEGLSNDDVVKGLKSALEVSTDTSVTLLHAVDGYYKDEAVKILLPPEAAVIFDNLSSFPGGQAMIDQTVLAINRAAEDAAVEAKPIFVNAITSINFDDAMGILNGHDSAATMYLHGKTYNDLVSAFSPKISTSLSKPLIGATSAEDLYSSLVGSWNNIANQSFGLLKPITSNTLGEYTTKKALDGLFSKVVIEEDKIRNDVDHRVNDILKKVFTK